MKEWLTARELADEGLQALPSSKRGVNEIAYCERWNEHPAFARKRAGRGGGMEYHINILPVLAQVAYKRKHLTIGALDSADDQAAPAQDAATKREKLTRDARLAVLRQFDRYHDGFSGMRRHALQTFADKYNNRSLHIEDWVMETLPRITKMQLQRWLTRRKKGLSLGFDRAAARKGKGILDRANDGAVRTTILALVADNMHFTAEHIRDVIESEYGARLTIVSGGREKSVPLPPIRTFQHFLKALRESEEVTLMRVQNPDRFRSTMAPRGTGTLAHITEPNGLWQIDASPVDALCTDGRHAIYVCLDIATRRMILLVSRTPRASAVALLIRKAILAWGVADTIKTDNGSDFVARDTKRLFAALGIEIELSDAYTPQQKGHVERAIGDFQHDCATMLPGFVGHNVADRTAIEGRKSFAQRLGTSDEEAFGVSLSGDELQVQIDRWAAVREHEVHSTLKTTPALAATNSTKPIRHVDERALDVLLMTVPGGGTRRVTSSGIRVDGNRYMTPTILPGTDVLVRMDSADLGLVYAFKPDGEEFLGVGICPALSGIEPAEAAKTLKAMQNEITAKGAAAIKAEIRRLKKGGAWHERILGVREGRTPNVVAMPKRSEAHSTPQIEAALAALDTGKLADDDTGLTDAQKRLIEHMNAEEEADAWAKHRDAMAEHDLRRDAERSLGLPENVTRLPETAKEKYIRALKVDAEMKAGTADPKDAHWLARFEMTAEYRGQAAMHEDFGDAYLAG